MAHIRSPALSGSRTGYERDLDRLQGAIQVQRRATLAAARLDAETKDLAGLLTQRVGCLDRAVRHA